MKHTKWTQEQIDYLCEHWGNKSIPTMSNALDKSINAIKLKAGRLGLGRHIHSGKDITFNQLLKAFQYSSGYTEQKKKFIRHGFKFTSKKTLKKSYLMVNISDFWKWAENNKNILNFAKLKSGDLGPEPKWVSDKRAADYLASKFKKTPWTPTEDSLLKSLLNSYSHSYSDISKRLVRTEGAVKRRVVELGIKQRPLKADNHTPWTDREVSILLDMHNKGYSADIISERIGTKSALAVNGKIERIVIERRNAV